MKRTALKIFNSFCGIVVMLALMAGISTIPASALTNGVYIAKASAHYKHPTTGVIADAGGEGSYTLGQAMSESVLHKQALVEVDSSGNTYLTLRLNLMDNIKNPKFKVEGINVSSSIIQNDNNKHTTDYRIKINGEKSIIECNIFVTPMGREVIFYITASELKEGSGDFITNIKNDTSSSLEPQNTQNKPQISKPDSTPVPSSNGKVNNSSAKETIKDNKLNKATEKVENNKPQKEETSNVTSNKISQNNTETNNTSTSLQENITTNDTSLASQENIESVTSESNNKYDNNSSKNSSVIWWTIGVLVIIGLSCVGIWFLINKKKHK